MIDNTNNGTPNREAKPQRDERGLFLPGNTVSKGHPSPHTKKIAGLRAELFRAIDAEKWREVILAMHKEAVGVWDAIEGKWASRPSVAAATWLADRLIGKPVEAGAEDRLKRIEEALGLSNELDPEYLASILESARREGDDGESGDNSA
ncbi:MAG: hypothetical protein GIKADHBN_03399 [Phycisphaerales bacterium]|nr:hypothetical protein [Phycisphaerales bacterium]